MKNQFFRDDLVVAHKFYRQNGDTQEQVSVPEHVRLTFFTAPESGFIRVERNGDKCNGCIVSPDGMTLTSSVSLSRTCIGKGALMCIIEEFKDDQAFPQGVMINSTPVRLDVFLSDARSDDAEDITSDVTFGEMTRILADIEDAEKKREANESVRQTQESIRRSYEDSRNKNEIARRDAESVRESNENARQTFIEAVMEHEIERMNAEKSRESAESQRVAAESSRAEAESLRESAEQGRKDAETARVSAEQSRVKAEQGRESKVSEIRDFNDFLKRDIGYNASYSTITLQLGVSGKYVKCSTRSAASNSSFAISKPFDVEACSELLIKTGYNPSDASHAALDISVISLYEVMERQRTVQKKDEDGNPLYYVTIIDSESGNVTVTTDETTDDTGYPIYTVETYEESRYLPNNEDKFVAIPDSEYYVAIIPQSCKAVVSYKPGITDMKVLVSKHGALANLASQIFGIYEHRTMVEAMASLYARVAALENSRGLIGNATAGMLDAIELTRFRYPLVLYGHGVPAAANIPVNLPDGLPWDGIPVFIGQLYINLDASESGVYYAIGHDAVSNWKQA